MARASRIASSVTVLLVLAGCGTMVSLDSDEEASTAAPQGNSAAATGSSAPANQAAGSVAVDAGAGDAASAETCKPIQGVCGTKCGVAVDDGCGTQVTCPACPCKPNANPCGSLCGVKVDDGCGTMVTCQACPCIPNPNACAGQCGVNVDNGCGTMVTCPVCCQSREQACAGIQCGQVTSNCGVKFECDDLCLAPNLCEAGMAGKNKCCVPLTRPQACPPSSCGLVVDDGCGGTITCGACCQGQHCLPEIEN